MPAKLRKGDEVIVLAGKDKGKKGTITSVAVSYTHLRAHET